MLGAAHAQGINLGVTSGYRSQAHQDRLFANSDHSGHWVARHSHHTMGIAADLRGDLGWAHRHAREFGLKFPMPWERWHIEPEGSRRRTFIPPPKRSGGSVTQVDLHMDGRLIHREVVRHMVDAATHPTSAPYFDGVKNWSPPDQGLIGV